MSAYRWVILATAFGLQAVFTMLQQGIPILTPYFRTDLGLSLAATGALVSCFNAGLAISSFPSGLLVDRLGERRTVTTGAICTCVLVLVAVLFHTLALAVGGLLFVAGLLSGTVGLSSSKAVFSWFGARERGLAMGVRQIAVPVGAGIASIALPRLGLRGGWELALGIIAVAQLAAALLFLASLRTAVGERAPIKTKLASQLAAVLGHRDLMITGSASVLMVMAQYALLAYLILFLGQQGWATLSASVALLLVQVGAVVGRMAWGAASDRLFGGARRPAVVRIVVLAAAALAGLSAVQGGWPHWTVLALAAAVGATALSWNGLMVTLMAELGGAARAGAAMGLNATAVFLGALIATPLFGAVVDASHSYRVAFLGLAGVMLCSLLPLAFVREAAPEQRTLTLVS